MHRKKRRKLAIIVAVLIAMSLPFAARAYLFLSAQGRVCAGIDKAPHRRVAIVLGAGVRPDGRLSTLLADRVDTGVRLYKAGKADILLMSGDNRVSHYNEPQRMRQYAIKQGVRAEDVKADYAGRRTYDTVYRAKHIFGVDRCTIVTQGFHVDRTLFLCSRLGVDAYAVPADVPGHSSLKARVREIPACLGALVDIYLRRPSPVMGKPEKI